MGNLALLGQPVAGDCPGGRVPDGGLVNLLDGTDDGCVASAKKGLRRLWPEKPAGMLE